MTNRLVRTFFVKRVKASICISVLGFEKTTSKSAILRSASKKKGDLKLLSNKPRINPEINNKIYVN
jgi:hypothetical protein